MSFTHLYTYFILIFTGVMALQAGTSVSTTREQQENTCACPTTAANQSYSDQTPANFRQRSPRKTKQVHPQATEPSERHLRKIHYIIKTIESGRDSTASWQLNQLLFEAMDDERMTVMILNEASRLFQSNNSTTLLKIFQLVISSVNINPVDVFLLLLDTQYSHKSTSISKLKDTVQSLTKNVLKPNNENISGLVAPKRESGIKLIKKLFEHIFAAVKPNDAEWLRLENWLGRDFLESLQGLSGSEAYLMAIKSIEAEMKGEMLTPNQWYYIQELYHSCIQASTTEELTSDWEEKLADLNGTCNGAFGRRYILNSHTRRILSGKLKNQTDAPTVISSYVSTMADRRFDYIDVKIRDDILLAHLTQVVFNAVERGHFTCNQSRLSLDLLNWLGRNRGINIRKYPCILNRTENLISSQYLRSKSFGKTLHFIHSALPILLEKTGLGILLEICEREKTLPQDVFLLGCYLYKNNMTKVNLWSMLPEEVQGQVMVLMSEQVLKWVVRVDDCYYEIVPRSFELVKIAFLGDMAAGEPQLWLFMPHAITGEHFHVGIYSLDKEEKEKSSSGSIDAGNSEMTLRKIYESFSYIRGNRFASFMSSSTFRLTMLDNMETFYLLREDIPFCLHRDSKGVPLSLNLCIGDYLEGERAEFFVCPDENDWSQVLEQLKAKYVG